MTAMMAQASDLTKGKVLATSDGTLTLGLAESEYQIELAFSGETKAEVGKPIRGRIRAKAQRVDVVTTGGRFVEPVAGRPRRIQGRIIGTDPVRQTVSVQCAPGCVFTCDLMRTQRAEEFADGNLVAFNIERGAWFEPMDNH